MEDKKEIIVRLDSLKELFLEKFDTNEKDHSNILTQTTKTNGRVTSLEDWKNKVIGALIMTNIIILPVLFILIREFLIR